MKKSIIIVTKHPDSKGGVVNYYNHFFNAFESEEFELEWFTLGSRPGDYEKRLKRKFSYSLEFVKDILRFIKVLFKNKNIKVVQVSPSFFEVPILRDCIYLFIARLFRKKTVVFFRGWSTKFENRMCTKPGLYKYILWYYTKSDALIILAEKFKSVLINYGFDPKKIEVTRTMFVKDDIMPKTSSHDQKTLKFLFLARISYQKGVIDILDAIHLINKKGIKIDIEIYGHFANEKVSNEVNKRMNEYELEDQVLIRGFIAGKEKYKKLNEADVFLFPTYHDEGCPNSIIEALASGLYIVSTPIGAIDEIVHSGKNGLIISPKNPDELSEAMIWTIKNSSEVRKIGASNASYASINFEQDVIVAQIKNIYQSII